MIYRKFLLEEWTLIIQKSTVIPPSLMVLFLLTLGVQLTAKLMIGRLGPSAARPAAKEPGRGQRTSLKTQKMEELPVHKIWMKKKVATLTNAKVV